MDIEFIICWEDRTWTTEIYSYEKADLPLNSDSEIDFNKICTDRLEKIIEDIIPAAKSGFCPRGGPVHVGIYHYDEDIE